MKKIYIKPENLVVAINVRDNIMLSGSTEGSPEVVSGGDYTEPDPEITVGAREVIRSRDAWEEW